MTSRAAAGNVWRNKLACSWAGVTACRQFAACVAVLCTELRPCHSFPRSPPAAVGPCKEDVAMLEIQTPALYKALGSRA